MSRAKKIQTVAFLAVLAHVASATGCVKKEEESTASSSTTTGNAPVGVVDDSAGFYMTAIANPSAPMVVHRGNPGQYNETGSYNSLTQKCVVSSTSDPITSREIMCYVEAEELDLYFWGVTLQYNIPSTMCTYARFTPYYYWGLPAGSGPTASAHNINSNGDPIDVENSKEGKPYCAFDYTEEGGPNCCEGSYTLTKGTWDEDTMGYIYASTRGEWGGKIANCLDGPAVKSQKKTKDNWPMADLFYVGGIGINKSYEIASPISLTRGDNIHAANYFNSTDFQTRSTWPRAFNPASAVVTAPPSSPGASATTATQTSVNAMPFYEVACLDRNNEIKARIRMMVRSWDKANMARIAYATTAGNDTFFPDDPIHDHDTWEDYRILNAGNWLHGFPGLYFEN